MKNRSDWSCAPVASRSRNPDHLEQLVASEHLDVIRHLSFNKKLDKPAALEILDNHKDNEVRLGLASTFVQDNEVIEKIIATRSNKGRWELALLEATNPSTSSKQLRQIYYDSTELCVHRAIALHPNCPKHQAEIFGCYLRKDLKNNPKFGLALMENKKLPYHIYSDWSYLNRMKEGSAPAFLSNPAAKDNSIEFSRGAASCPSVNAVFLDRAVLNGDQTTYKHLLNVNLAVIGRFAHEVLSLTTPANKKILIKNVKLHPSIVERLANDKDKSVRLAIENSTQGPKKSKSTEKAKATGNLGNKAARLELAEGSADTDILRQLCNDKLPAVRAKVVENTHVTPDMLMPLLTDSDSEVVNNALEVLNQRTLDKGQQQEKQATLIAALGSIANIEKQVASKFLDAIEDVSAIENAYMMGKLTGLEGSVASRVETESVFNALLSQAQQQGSSAADWCVELSSYKSVNASTFNEIIKITGPVVGRRIQIDKTMSYHIAVSPLRKLKSADVYIEIVKTNGWDWVKTSDCAYPAEANFSIEQMEILCSVAPGCLMGIGEACNNLSAKQLIETFSLLDPKEKLEFVSHVPATNSEFNQQVFDWCTEHYKKNDECDSTLALYFERQDPTSEQQKQGLGNKDENIRCAMARNPRIQGDSLSSLVKDKDSSVRECLFYRGEADDIEEGEEYVTQWGGEHIPDDIMTILASDQNRYIKNRAQKILSIRGVDLNRVRSNVTSNITNLLKKHQAPFGAAKANKKLLELGVLEMAERESTAKAGVMREFKQLSDDGQKYGVNKFSEYGDATPEYYIDLFPELLKKIA